MSLGIDVELKLTCDKCGTTCTLNLWSIEHIKEAIKTFKWDYIYRLSEGNAKVYCPKCKKLVKMVIL
jgi:ribosomal protein L44E